MADRLTATVWIVRWIDFEANALLPLLDEDERSRAARSANEAARSRYVIARGLLRCLIGRDLGMDPTDVPFDYGPTGKPRLATALNVADLRFSVSHTDELGLIGIARNHAIGVDVERRQGHLPFERLASRFFTGDEAARLRDLPVRRRADVFMKAWTAKEALIKAEGTTVPRSLRRYELDFHDDDSVSLRSVAGDVEAAQRRRLELTRLDDAHIAAVAIHAADVDVHWEALTRAPRRASA